MKKWKASSNTSGVSEVIGTILLLSISVTLFSVVYVTVLSFPGAPSTPSSNIAMSLNETSLILTHAGGKPLGLDSKIKIMVDDAVHTYELSAGLNTTEIQDDLWGFGEQFELPLSEIGITPGMIEYTLNVAVIDVNSNSVVMIGNKVISNKAPVISSPIPYNTSIKIPVSLSHLNITISDPDYDAFTWSIETSPNIGYASGSMQVYAGKEFSCPVTITVKTSAIYFWFVNATDINGKSTHKVYTFITGSSVDHKDAVDSNTSDLDGSTDKGIELFFTNAQQNTTDGSVVTLEESDYGHQEYLTGVQGNTVNEDGVADIGTESGFANAQGTSRDNVNMSITEANGGWSSGSETWRVVDSYSGSYTAWTEVGSSPYLGVKDYNTNYIYSAKQGNNEGWFGYTDSTAPTSATCTVTLGFYCRQAAGGDDTFSVYADWTGGTGTLQGTITPTAGTAWTYKTLSLSSTITGLQADSLQIYIIQNKVGASVSQADVDYAYYNVSWTGNYNYRADFEYNWSTAHFSEQTMQLCFYVQRHTGGTENLMVKYWTGSTWVGLGNITTVGWTNLTAVGLTSSTYIIRLNGSQATNDLVQDTWDIDCIFLHTMNGTNYKIDFEYQWSHANYTDTQKKVCMYITSKIGTEPLNIAYRDGTVWTSIGTIAGTGWVNVTATGLSSSTYTIQLIGASETNDAEKDSWNIDCIYLHTWT